MGEEKKDKRSVIEKREKRFLMKFGLLNKAIIENEEFWCGLNLSFSTLYLFF